MRSGAIAAEARATAELPPMKPGLIQSRTALLIGAALCFIGMAVIFLMLLVRGEGRARRGVVSSLGGTRAKRPSAVAGMADWATTMAEKMSLQYCIATNLSFGRRLSFWLCSTRTSERPFPSTVWRGK